jgi:CheY-like chemotaxis protein
MATEKIELGLHGIKSIRKIPFAKWLPIGSLLILTATILRFGSASGGAEVSTRANQTNSANFQTALRAQMHADSELPQENHEEEPKVNQWHSVLLAIEMAVCMVLTFRLIIPNLGKMLDKSSAAVSAEPEAKPKADAVARKTVANVAGDLPVKPKSFAESAEQRKGVEDEFFKAAPLQLAGIMKIFAQVGRSTEPTVRQKFLEDLGTGLSSLKNRVGSLELTPAWQLASCLEKLITELHEKPSNVTSPTLRTAGSGLLLLKDLCAPNVRKDLATEPPARFLVVDDDLITRQAVSTCLKKLAQTPDLAENGETALKLAEQQRFDAIFLDVEMPGLDGFEVCTKIHQLELNRKAPVVFVTSHENYESRRKSNPSGKTDLIVKPFPVSEITLKALVLLLRGRLDKGEPAIKSSKSQTANPKEAPISHPQTNPSAEPSSGDARPELVASAPIKQKADSTAAKPADSRQTEELSKTLRELRDQVSALSATEHAELRQEILNELYVGSNLIRSEAARTGLRAVCELSSALGKLISKVLDKPKLHTPSTIQAISAAIQLLEELAHSAVEPELANAPVRALVVDDEPLARRAISNALQLTISKPDNAESGIAALALAQSKIFDVIFLDILMPEMDGFETCSKIRQTSLNRATPIIFVTSSTDTESRDKAFQRGGDGFISKPVLPAEIFLTALTYTLRARAGKGTAAGVLEEAVC